MNDEDLYVIPTEEQLLQDKITVIETIYYRPYLAESSVVDNRFNRDILSGEQPYQRQNYKDTIATEEWKQIDIGWLKDSVGMLVIANDEGTFYETIPTKREKEETSRRIIEIGISIGEEMLDFVWYILPEESLRSSPSDVSRLFIRCQYGTARYTLTAYPK